MTSSSGNTLSLYWRANHLSTLLLFIAFSFATHAFAQQPITTASADLPDAPGYAALDIASQSTSAAPQSTPADANTQPHQTKRILGVIPNFRAVTADTKLPSQPPKEKFKTMLQDSFDYSSFEFAAAVATVDYIENSDPEFNRGGVAYGRYLWHDFVDQTSENFFVEFAVPTITHEDTRYYTLGHGTILHRGIYSVSRILITRTDSGGRSFNFSEVVGAGTAAGMSNLYYPSRDRDWTKTGQRWVFNLGVDGASFAVKEFWPDINRAIFHQKN